MANYFVRGTSPFGYMPSVNFSNDQYGRVVEGNLNNSYGPWSDPELQRMPHRLMRRSPLNMRRRRQYEGFYMGGF